MCGLLLWKNRATECKFPDDFKDQAIRDKLVLSCHEDNTKLKLYDASAKLAVKKAILIILWIEATSIELRESKTSSIDAVSKLGVHRRNYNDNKPYSTGKTCDQFNPVHKLGKKFCPAVGTKCRKCGVVGHYSKSKRCTGKGQNSPKQIHLVSQDESEQIVTESENSAFLLVVWLIIEIVPSWDGMRE